MASSIGDASFEKWFWIELIGFDNTQSDFGVRACFERAGFVPEGVTLLLSNSDFINAPEGLEQDAPLPFDCCSYGGHPRNAERERQVWTRWQVKGLVQELQRHGSKVYCSVFGSSMSAGWNDKHREVLFHSTRQRAETRVICIWKRFSDNTYYEDFFVRKLVAVMQDYGFDGYHGADCYSPQLLAIYDGDFSDDVVDQFLSATGIALPSGVKKKCNGDTALLEQRALWIWKTRRREWIAFHVQRIVSFWRKVADALHGLGKAVVLNSFWTRDPFEAVYRYGSDYRKLAEAGVDGFIVESAAAAHESMEFGEPGSRILCNFMAAQLLIKAHAPAAPLRWLHGVKDVQEGWDTLHDTPRALDSEIFALNNLYWNDPKGKTRRCANGLVVCTPDGIIQEDWRRLRQTWDLSVSLSPARVLGATLIWSEQAFERQMDDFITTRRWTTHRLVHHLIARGAPIHAVVDVKNLDVANGPLLLLNPHLFPEEEIREVMAYRRGPVITIGGKATALPQPEFRFEDVYPPNQLICGVYRAGQRFDVSVVKEGDETPPAEMSDISDPASWVDELYFRRVSDSFLKSCAEVLCACSHGMKIRGNWGLSIRGGALAIGLTALEETPGRIRVLLRNDRYVYAIPRIETGRKIKSMRLLTGGCFMVLNYWATCGYCSETEFEIGRIPPRGTSVLEITFA